MSYNQYNALIEFRRSIIPLEEFLRGKGNLGKALTMLDRLHIEDWDIAIDYLSERIKGANQGWIVCLGYLPLIVNVYRLSKLKKSDIAYQRLLEQVEVKLLDYFVDNVHNRSFMDDFINFTRCDESNLNLISASLKQISSTDNLIWARRRESSDFLEKYFHLIKACFILFDNYSLGNFKFERFNGWLKAYKRSTPASSRPDPIPYMNIAWSLCCNSRGSNISSEILLQFVDLALEWSKERGRMDISLIGSALEFIGYDTSAKKSLSEFFNASMKIVELLISKTGIDMILRTNISGLSRTCFLIMNKFISKYSSGYEEKILEYAIDIPVQFLRRVLSDYDKESNELKQLYDFVTELCHELISELSKSVIGQEGFLVIHTYISKEENIICYDIFMNALMSILENSGEEVKNNILKILSTSIFVSLPHKKQSSFTITSNNGIVCQYLKVCGESYWDKPKALMESCMNVMNTFYTDEMDYSDASHYVRPLYYILTGAISGMKTNSKVKKHDLSNKIAEFLPLLIAFTLHANIYRKSNFEFIKIKDQINVWLENVKNEIRTVLTPFVAQLGPRGVSCLELANMAYLSYLEKETLEMMAELPQFYCMISSLFGEILYRYRNEDGKDAVAYNQVLDRCLGLAVRASKEHKWMNIPFVSYMNSCLEDILVYIKQNRFIPIPSLARLPNLNMFIDTMNPQIVKTYTSFLIDIDKAIELSCQAFDNNFISSREIETFRINSEYFHQVSGAFGNKKIPTEKVNKLMQEIKQEELLNKDLGDIILFLDGRMVIGLLPGNKLLYNDPTSITLPELRESNQHILSILNINVDIDADVFRGLRTFARGSTMFASRFTNAIRQPNSSLQIATRTALDGLRKLVCGSEVRIGEFSGGESAHGSSLLDLVTELQQRRRATIAAELKSIANFFSQDSDNQTKKLMGAHVEAQARELEQSLQRLTSAFELLKYRDHLKNFKVAVRDLKLIGDHSAEAIDGIDAPEIYEDFLLSRAPVIAENLRQLLCGLRPWDISFVGRLTSATLLLEFLRRYGDTLEVSGSLDRAQNRAASDDHAMSILLKLVPMRNLLKPFYNRSLESLRDMKNHLALYLRPNMGGMQPDTAESEPVAVAELINISENWSLVEFYFRDSADVDSGAEVVERLVEQYLATGQYVSSLRGHANGASLSFTYLTAGRLNDRKTLPSNLLLEQVQAAVLALGSGKDPYLQEFIQSFELAGLIHEKRLALESAGHPSFQAEAGDPAIICEQMNCNALRIELENLNAELLKWEELMQVTCLKCPRLLLLNRLSKLRFIQSCQYWHTRVEYHNDTTSYGIRLMFPYVIQCFPTLLHERTLMSELLTTYLKNAITQPEISIQILSTDFSNPLEAIGFAVALIQFLEKELVTRNLISVAPDDSIKQVTRVYISDASSSTDSIRNAAYVEHLADMISEGGGSPGMPSQVLWGDSSVTIETIREFLSLATVPGLCSTLHVMMAELLHPSVREELLKQLQTTLLYCPLVLIFCRQEGSEVFSQYQINPVSTVNPRDLSANLWINKTTGAAGENKPAIQLTNVWVVTGASGMGKTRWIEEHYKSCESTRKHYERFPIHEGFSASALIRRFRCITADSAFSCSAHELLIALHFDITSYGNLRSFGKLLHYLISTGLLIDENTGKADRLLHNIRYNIYIELPALSKEQFYGDRRQPASDWPQHVSDFAPSKHPFLSEYFPILCIAVPPNQMIAIKPDHLYALDNKTKLVATYLNLSENGNFRNINVNNLPAVADESLSDDNVRAILQMFWNNYKVDNSKRIRSNTILILHSRIMFLLKIKGECNRINANGLETPLSNRFKTMEGFMKVFEVAKFEAALLSDCSPVMRAVAVWSIRPSNDLEGFDILLTAPSTSSRDAKEIIEKYYVTKTLSTESGKIPPLVRAIIAPAFGMDNTADMCTTLRDCGHLLTPDSLVRLLHMHGRREIKTSVIYEGETGVGKSQNLLLYSHLINNDGSLFTNLKLHFIAVLRTFVMKENIQNAIHGNDDHEEGYNNFIENVNNIIQMNGMRVNDITVGEVILTSLAYIRYDTHNLINRLGAALCSYFNRLFESYQLHKEGLSVAVKSILLKYHLLLNSRPELVLDAEKIASDAMNELYLPPRPIVNDKKKTDKIPLMDPMVINDSPSSTIPTPIEKPRNQGEITVYVRTVEGDVYPINVNPAATTEYTIQLLRNQYRRLALESTCQLVFGSTVLDRNRTFSEYNIQNETILTIVVSARNGELLPNIESPKEANLDLFKGENEFRDFIQALITSPASSLYYRILADEGLTPAKWREFIRNIKDTAKRLLKVSSSAVVSVFVDELNTAGCLGMVTEAFISHSIDGEQLPANVFFVGAINPLRTNQEKKAINFTRTNISTTYSDTDNPMSKASLEIVSNNHLNNSRCQDDDEDDDATGGIPYIVKPLSPTLSLCRVEYPSLGSRSIKRDGKSDRRLMTTITQWSCQFCTFINSSLSRRCDMCDSERVYEKSDYKRADIGDGIAQAEHAFVEEYFREHVSLSLPPEGLNRFNWSACCSYFPTTAIRLITTAQSLVHSYNIPRVYVSIRDLLRAIKIFQWLLTHRVPTERDDSGNATKPANIFLPKSTDVTCELILSLEEMYMRQALIIALAITYWCRLPSSGHVLVGKAEKDLRTEFIRDISKDWAELMSITQYHQQTEKELQRMLEEEFRLVVERSLNHLWSYALIPRGLAHTVALKVSFSVI